MAAWITGLRQVRISKPELALIGVTAIWGTTFLVVHKAMEVSGPLFFVGLRFLAAGLISLIFFWRIMPGTTKREWLAGSLIGILIFVGYGLQTSGLQTVDSSTSAFITALYVPLVPLLQWLIFRKAPKAMTIVGAVIAFVGLILLSLPSLTGIGISGGEIATFIATIAFAFEILLIGFFAGSVNVGRVTVIQLMVGGLLSLLAMPVFGEAIPEFSWVWLLAALGLGVASYLIQVTMNWAQRTVSPTRATIIYAGEPVWAGALGRLAGERLPFISLVGAALIVVSIVISELRAPKGTRKPEDEKFD